MCYPDRPTRTIWKRVCLESPVCLGKVWINKLWSKSYNVDLCLLQVNRKWATTQRALWVNNQNVGACRMLGGSGWGKSPDQSHTAGIWCCCMFYSDGGGISCLALTIDDGVSSLLFVMTDMRNHVIVFHPLSHRSHLIVIPTPIRHLRWSPAAGVHPLPGCVIRDAVLQTLVELCLFELLFCQG